MTLPYDISRCHGTTAELCESCRRREPGSEYQSYIEPAVTNIGCANYIAPVLVIEGSK